MICPNLQILYHQDLVALALIRNPKLNWIQLLEIYEVLRYLKYQKLFDHFTDLRDLRIWADYKVEEILEANTNLPVLFQKTFRFINSSKLIV